MIKLTHDFVEYIPEHLSEGVLYVSMRFGTVVHKCCCGCGREVVTPLSPRDWTLSFDGRTVSLDPSIGNWSFPCQSHYWITHNRVEWGKRWTPQQIAAGRAYDRNARDGHSAAIVAHAPAHDSASTFGRLWKKIHERFR